MGKRNGIPFKDKKGVKLINTTKTKSRGRPRKSAAQIGANKAIKTASTKIIKDTIKVSNPLTKVVIIAALGAVVSYFLNKR